MTEPVPLIAEALSRSYGDQTVVDNANLTLAPGKITALLGASGTGKSTLLRLLAGLERPNKGQIRLGDTVLSDAQVWVPAEKRRIGLIFQDFALFPHLTLLQNIMFGLEGQTKEAARATAHDWLWRIQLAERASAYPHELSGGQQQRIAIARALAPDPVAILMDEPFSGLDPALREDVRFMALDAIRASRTPALLVTHDASEAMLSADYLAVMRAGKIVQQDTPEMVYTQPVDKETATALGPIILLSGRVNPDLQTIATPFGPVAKANLKEIDEVTIGLRPEAVLLDPASPIKAGVLAVRRNGPMRQLHLTRQGVSAFILAPAQTTVQIGDEVGIRLDPQGCSVF